MRPIYHQKIFFLGGGPLIDFNVLFKKNLMQKYIYFFYSNQCSIQVSPCSRRRSAGVRVRGYLGRVISGQDKSRQVLLNCHWSTNIGHQSLVNRICPGKYCLTVIGQLTLVVCHCNAMQCIGEQYKSRHVLHYSSQPYHPT